MITTRNETVHAEPNELLHDQIQLGKALHSTPNPQRPRCQISIDYISTLDTYELPYDLPTAKTTPWDVATT